MEILKVDYKMDYIYAKIIGFALGIAGGFKLGIIGSIYLGCLVGSSEIYINLILDVSLSLIF